jgi:heme/copper-type cytochrome/quinol oxidase subunit 2
MTMIVVVLVVVVVMTMRMVMMMRRRRKRRRRRRTKHWATQLKKQGAYYVSAKGIVILRHLHYDVILILELYLTSFFLISLCYYVMKMR